MIEVVPLHVPAQLLSPVTNPDLPVPPLLPPPAAQLLLSPVLPPHPLSVHHHGDTDRRCRFARPLASLNGSAGYALYLSVKCYFHGTSI